MSKYTFERLGSERFETLAQALLEKIFRTEGELTQFGKGKDGAREATWLQPTSHPQYTRPVNSTEDNPKRWVFQVKYHDIGLRGWSKARAEVESELHSELTKLVTTYKVPCDKYVLITNVPFSGVINVGTRDKVNKVVASWRDHVPEIEVWDAVDLSRMLDADPGTRTTYLDDVLPGDVLRALIKSIGREESSRVGAIRTFLKSIVRAERRARAEEAGDESSLQLDKVYVDLDLKLVKESLSDESRRFVEPIANKAEQLDADDEAFPNAIDKIPASFAFLRADCKSMLLKGGPGVGKSTITQFLTLYHAARLVDPSLAKQLEKRLKLAKSGIESLDSHSRVRLPIRVELRRYAQWIADEKVRGDNIFLASYIAECIARAASSTSFGNEDVFLIASENPVLLMLDGLDEVPNPSVRQMIFSELTRFLDRCEGENCDIQLLLSSRPQGYRGEFDLFSPVEWQVMDLARGDFDDYTERWLDERIPNIDEKNDARRRIVAGMESKAVQQMAVTLLQATVMLTIVRQKHAIPHARHKLYEKYVDVIFAREQTKETVRHYGDELKRLHELVGFELICRTQASDQVQTLGGEEFAQCVRKVIEDFGPSDLGTVTISEIVQSIVTVAKDRLCLLAGKGEDQENVDFVIQPFREYFAASYLARHESAAPDALYANLVKRRHIWGNVLQFYTAFQSAAQQRNWISEADGAGADFSDFENVVEYTRRRRALLRVLPEFERLRNDYITRALRNLLRKETRWTWKGREDFAELLSAFAQNDAYLTTTKVIGDASKLDLQNLYVEIDLIIKLGGLRYRSEVRELLNELMKDPRLHKTVISASLNNSLGIDVSSASDQDLNSLVQDDRFYRRSYDEEHALQYLQGLNDSRVIDLVFKHAKPFMFNAVGNKFERKWINELANFLRGKMQLCQFGPVGVMLPYFLEDRTSISTEEIERNLKGLPSSASSPYLIALIDAIKNPDDPSKYEIARIEQVKCRIPDDSKVAIRPQLGPAPDEFNSTKEWVERRKKSSLTLKNFYKDFQVVSPDINSFFFLFFHPSVLKEIHSVDNGMSVNDLYSMFFGLYEFVPWQTNSSPFRIVTFSGNGEFDLHKLCLRVIEVLASNGAQFLTSDAGVLKWMFHATSLRTSLEQAMEVIDSSFGLTVPESWAGIFVAFCALSDDIKAECILDFWKRLGSPTVSPLRNGQNERLLAGLLALRSQDADKLAAFLSSSISSRFHRNQRSSVLTDVSFRLCKSIISTSSPSTNELMLLLRQIPVKEELRIWTNENVGKIHRDFPWAVESLADRFGEIASFPGSDPHSLRKEFGRFIQGRDQYPVEIAIAALDAILRIDELTCRPLNDADWRRFE